jgi:AraC family transcriptional regulator
MKATATGRVLVWRGASLWIGRGGEPTDFHAHHAIQISLPLSEQHVKFRLPGEPWKPYSAALVAAQQRHALDARDVFVAQIFAEPESRVGRMLQLRHADKGIAVLPKATLDKEIAALASAYQDRADDARLMALAHATLAVLCGPDSKLEPGLDSRVQAAIELIRDRLGSTLELAEVAARVHLSPERFRHLFVEHTGVRFRAYILWVRLECALAAYVAGRSLTEAAQAGGFSDSAHLSRTFKKMFGISAASINLE